MNRLSFSRTKLFALLLAPALIAGVVSLSCATGFIGAAQAASSGPKVSAKVGKPLNEAQELLKNNDLDGALAKIKEAQGLATKPEELYVVNDMFYAAYVKKQDYANAAEVFEKLFNSPYVPEAEKQRRMQDLVTLYQRAKNQEKAMHYSRLYMQTYGADGATAGQAAFMQYQSGDYAGTIATLKPLVSEPNVSEDVLKLYLNAQRKLNDVPGARATLKQLALKYPSKLYWGDYLNLLQYDARDERVIIQTFRLQRATDTLITADDYAEAGALAMKLGFPGEAQLFLNDAKAKGLMKASSSETLSRANAQAGSDRASLPAQDRQANASSSGQAYVTLGEAYASYGMYGEAVSAYQKGIAKGGLKNASEAQLNLGVAQILSGQKEAASQTLSQIPATGTIGELAEAWLAYIKQQG